MSGTVCLLVSLGVIAIGVVALIVGMRGDTMTAGDDARYAEHPPLS